MESLTINSKYNSGLSRFFSSSILNDLARKGHSAFFNEMLSVSGLHEIIDENITMSDFLQIVYNHLFKNYRSEYIYKNAIANKILLGKHSLNTAFMLTEFRVADCKADTVVLNGTSNVYEIKSEFDSMYRLKRQIDAYSQVFDFIHIITSPSQTVKVASCTPKSVGIMRLTNRNAISTVREAESGRRFVKPDIIFDSLRKTEYTSIIKEQYGYIPDLPNTQMHKACSELFAKLSPETAHDCMVKVLKARGKCTLLKDFITDIPECLRAYSINAGLSIKETSYFREMLNTKCIFFMK
ncbi:hypothetical protein BROC_01042 [Candidatus Brocadiaceae bacterium]|nr:hypothetical protein BROC_01042 [Candidatus Brocadiaceae bacterium]